MRIEEEKSVVVISIPRFCVPKRDAAQFIKAANEYWADTVEEMLSSYGPNVLKYDNKYIENEFIPTVKRNNSYSGILDEKIDVKQFDRYVELESDSDGSYMNQDKIHSLWHPELKMEPEIEIKEGNDESI